MKPNRLAFIVSMVLVPLAVSAQPKLYPVGGRVISQADGHPLARATLELLSIPERKLVQSTVSAEDGTFAFHPIPAGKYELQGEAPGFVTTIYDQHGGFSTAIVTGSTVTADSLVFQLIPKAALSGNVTESSGDAVIAATVFLFRQAEDFGEGPIAPAGTAITNDLGQYEFANLPTGSYLLAVQAQPWYAVNLNPVEANGNIGISGPSDPGLRVAYPITYYPGVTDPLQAGVIVLRPGDSSADLHLGAVPATQLTISNAIQSQRNARDGVVPVRAPQLRVNIFGTRQFVPATVQFLGNELVLGGIAPGEYTLTTNSLGQTSDARTLRISQTASARLPGADEGVHLHLTVRRDDGTSVPVRSLVSLVPAREASEPLTAPVDSKGEADLTVPAGDYFLQVTWGSHPAMVRQVLAGTKTIPSSPLHIETPQSSGHLAYSINVVPAEITVYGFAQKDGKPCPGAFVLLVPENELQRPRNWRTQQSDLDGSFDLSAVAPGAYFLFVIEKGWQLNWREDGVLAPYIPGATRVEIGDSPTHVQHLDQPIAVQPKL